MTYVTRTTAGQTALNLVAQIAALLGLVYTASTLLLRGIDYLGTVKGCDAARQYLLRSCRRSCAGCCCCCKSQAPPKSEPVSRQIADHDWADESGVTLADMGKSGDTSHSA